MTAAPKLLELAERGRKAGAEAMREYAITDYRHPANVAIAKGREEQAQTASQIAIARYREENKPGSIDRGTACPACDGLANRVGSRLECCWCGAVTEGKRVVDACRLFNGGWPEDKQEVPQP